MTDTPLSSHPTGTQDPLWRMRAYALAVELREAAWKDCEEIRRQAVTREVAPQLYRALGSIAANIAEGYSRGSGKDRVRFFEYALGSVRESTEWYELARPVLGSTTDQRLGLLTQVRRILLKVIPIERQRPITKMNRDRP